MAFGGQTYQYQNMARRRLSPTQTSTGGTAVATHKSGLFGDMSVQDGKLVKAGGDPLGVGGALNPPPQVAQFYQALLGQQLRGVADQTAAARSRAMEELGARGLGQSSLVGRTLSSIGRGQQQASLAATTNVQALQFQQLLAALDYERQRALLRLGKQLSGGNPFLNALSSLGGAAGFLFPAGGGGASTPAPAGPNPYPY